MFVDMNKHQIIILMIYTDTGFKNARNCYLPLVTPKPNNELKTNNRINF